ncbi:hypothetical protein VNO77_21262 [Canavalia gladiata]|uniref:Uncharacterized protein n=1 Tax=Canavalia gladiata TaxID=3824 RepID=A0AAN9LRN4_CANGL
MGPKPRKRFGLGRIGPMESDEYDENDDEYELTLPDGTLDIPNAMLRISVTDYPDPEPNTNPKNGYILSPPSPTPTPPPTA